MSATYALSESPIKIPVTIYFAGFLLAVIASENHLMTAGLGLMGFAFLSILTHLSLNADKLRRIMNGVEYLLSEE